MSLEVLKPGLLSTFQDRGRHGFQAIGMPVCGAMDALSHDVANLLVGNLPDEATLEITLTGPSLRFGRDCVLALAGADLGATLQPPGGAGPLALPPLRPMRIVAGSVLQFARPRAGVRTYLAIAGGYGLPAVMDSRSTYLRGGLGGWQGRALRKGDRLPLPPAPEAAPLASLDETAAAILLGLFGKRGDHAPLRVIEGPEWGQFTDEAQAALLAGSYRIGSQSDRMGYRLEGPVLQRSAPRDMLSEAVAFGTVQVPPDGQPIVLMADRQTTGGYPRLVQLAGVDLPRLAQCMPGDTVRFERISLEAAQRLLLRRASALARLREALRPTPEPTEKA